KELGCRKTRYKECGHAYPFLVQAPSRFESSNCPNIVAEDRRRSSTNRRGIGASTDGIAGASRVGRVAHPGRPGNQELDVSRRTRGPCRDEPCGHDRWRETDQSRGRPEPSCCDVCPHEAASNPTSGCGFAAAIVSKPLGGDRTCFKWFDL